MDREAQLAARQFGDAEFAVATQLQDQFRAIAAAFVDQHADPAQAISIVGAAAAMFAGMQFGQLIAVGAMRDQDQRRIIEVVTHNARAGIQVGKRRAKRIIGQTGCVQ